MKGEALPPSLRCPRDHSIMKEVTDEFSPFFPYHPMREGSMRLFNIGFFEGYAMPDYPFSLARNLSSPKRTLSPLFFPPPRKEEPLLLHGRAPRGLSWQIGSLEELPSSSLRDLCVEVESGPFPPHLYFQTDGIRVLSTVSSHADHFTSFSPPLFSAGKVIAAPLPL